MPEDTVNVRYIVKDVPQLRRLLHEALRFHGRSERPRLRRRVPRQPATAPQRTAELGRAGHARRHAASPGGLEPHPLHRR